MVYIKLYGIALVSFLAIDMVWLGVISKNFYQKHLGFLLGESILWTAAILLYLILIVGLVVFAISPALEKGSWMTALFLGALFGLITYATYDLTNQATIKNWPLIVTVVDILWGTIISASVSVFTYFIATKIGT